MLVHRHWLAACAFALLSACPTTPPPSPPASPPQPPAERFGRFIAHTLPSSPDPAQQLRDIGLPGGPDGSVAIPGSGLAFGVDPNDAISAAGRCRRWVTTCRARTEPFVPNLDDCVRSVPRCQTTTPQNEDACCAQACVTAYMDRRAADVAPLQAFIQTLAASSCHPGVEALVAPGAP